MKKYLKYCLLVWIAVPVWAQQTEVIGPDSHLKVNVALKQGKPVYSVTYKEKTILEDSPLGVVTDIGDFSRNMNWIGQKTSRIDKTYTQNKIKKSEIHYQANELICTFANADKQEIDVVFRVSNNDIAFRYVIPRKEAGSCVVEREATGFDFPAYTTTFLCPQSDAMIGWMRTKPSYEEEYRVDVPMNEPS